MLQPSNPPQESIENIEIRFHVPFSPGSIWDPITCKMIPFPSEGVSLPTIDTLRSREIYQHCVSILGNPGTAWWQTVSNFGELISLYAELEYKQPSGSKDPEKMVFNLQQYFDRSAIVQTMRTVSLAWDPVKIANGLCNQAIKSKIPLERECAVLAIAAIYECKQWPRFLDREEAVSLVELIKTTTLSNQAFLALITLCHRLKISEAVLLPYIVDRFSVVDQYSVSAPYDPRYTEIPFGEKLVKLGRLIANRDGDKVTTDCLVSGLTSLDYNKIMGSLQLYKRCKSPDRMLSESIHKIPLLSSELLGERIADRSLPERTRALLIDVLAEFDIYASAIRPRLMNDLLFKDCGLEIQAARYRAVGRVGVPEDIVLRYYREKIDSFLNPRPQGNEAADEEDIVVFSSLVQGILECLPAEEAHQILRGIIGLSSQELAAAPLAAIRNSSKGWRSAGKIISEYLDIEKIAIATEPGRLLPNILLAVQVAEDFGVEALTVIHNFSLALRRFIAERMVSGELLDRIFDVYQVADAAAKRLRTHNGS